MVAELNNEKHRNVEISVLGEMNEGRQVHLFRINGTNGTYLELSDLGARMTRLAVLDRKKTADNVLQAFEALELWRSTGKNHGATCGRFANRLAAASFFLNGNLYEVNANEGRNTLHGGLEGFNLKLWDTDVLDDQTVEFTYVSPDKEEGFPGELTATVRYHFDGERVTITESAKSSADTVVGLTNHAYFQISGAEKDKSILEQTLLLNADHYTVVDNELLPTGEIRPVAGTAFDYREAKVLGKDIAADDEQIQYGGGIDHNFVLKKKERGALELAAELYDPQSGRLMRTFTTKAGIQIYSGNAELKDPTNGELLYRKHGAICLETQGFPNSMEQTHFPSPVLRSGETYLEETVYEFTVK